MKEELHSEHNTNLSPFLLCLMESQLESETFFLHRGRQCNGLFNMFRKLMSTISKDQRCHGNKCAIRMPYLKVSFIYAQYDTMYIMII